MLKQVTTDENLDIRIHNFMKRKMRKYPELDEQNFDEELIHGSIDTVPRWERAIFKKNYVSY